MLKYLKFYFEPKSKDINEQALEYAKSYYKDKQYTLGEFKAFVGGYVGAYRHAYAKTKKSLF